MRPTELSQQVLPIVAPGKIPTPAMHTNERDTVTTPILLVEMEKGHTMIAIVKATDLPNTTEVEVEVEVGLHTVARHRVEQ